MSLDRTIAPPIHDALSFNFHLPPLSHAALSNGANLYWLRAGVQEVAAIDWVFPAGIWYEAHSSIANAVAGLLKSGTTNRTAAQINEELEYYGAQLNIGAGDDNTTVSLFCLSKHLLKLLPLVQEILQEATFPASELEIYKKNATQKLQVKLRDCDFVANRHIDALLFGNNHSYGSYSTVESIQALERDLVNAHYEAYFQPQLAQIFMGGFITDEHVKAVSELFGKLACSNAMLSPKAYPFTTAPERQTNIAHDATGVQGAIRIGRLFPNRQHPDYTPMVVLNTLFGGYFGSRLMSNIREDKGYTYGIYSSISPRKHGGSMIIHTETGRDVVQNAVAEIYKEMEHLLSEPIAEEELLLVKNYLLGNLLGDLDGPFSILNRWKSLILNGFDVAKFNQNVDTYKNVTTDTLQALAQKYFNPNDFIELVVL
ncbi:MAG: insulinase family protein [Chitinophagia bacterium]|nr:insulinase family protein [Chitinophagia bacterium]